MLSFKETIKLKLNEYFHLYNFNQFCDVLITETEDVTNHLKTKFPPKNIFTVTNYYNQTFDNPNYWLSDIKLPNFNGITLLTIAANYPHKTYRLYQKLFHI